MTIETHAAPLLADHVHPALVDTEIGVPEPPAAVTEIDVGMTEKAHCTPA
jgi:hypothetical protein